MVDFDVDAEEEDGDDDLSCWPASAEMIHYLRRTFGVRKQMRDTKVSAMVILNKFPMLLQFNGEMIDNEFNLMNLSNKKSQSFDMANISRRLDFYHFIPDNLLRCLFILKNHVASRGVRDKQLPLTIHDFYSEIRPLFYFVKVEDNLDELVKEIEYTHPFVFVQQTDHYEVPFLTLIVSQTQVPIGYCSYSRAIELIIKSSYVFNFKYEKSISNILIFYAFYVLNINKTPPKVSLEKFYNFF